MDNGGAFLVFIIDTYLSNMGVISLYIQRGDPIKRIGPFVSAKEQQRIVGFLPREDRILLDIMQSNGIAIGRSIDSRFEYFPEIAQSISQHKNLFVRTKRHGSIRKASPADRTAITSKVVHDSTASIGQLLLGVLEVTPQGELRLFWKYSEVKDTIPLLSLPSETEAIKIDDRNFIRRDVLTENQLLTELASHLNMSIGDALKGDFDGLDLSLLVNLPKKNWEIIYKGKTVALRAARFDKVGIAWFDNATEGDAPTVVDYDSLAEAYLRGRGRVEINGNLVFLPMTTASGLTEEIALRVATGSSPYIPYNKIVNARKHFENYDRIALKNELRRVGFNAELRNYQLDGVLWLSSLFDKGLGGILADEMGLGKTVQTLAFIAHRNIRSTLIVAPASVVPNWERELAKFAPWMQCIVDSLASPSSGTTSRVVILSYQRALRCIEIIQETSFDLLILDEGQFVKNVETKTAIALRKSISQMRLVLTGTPIENSVNDLWAHLTFTNQFLLEPFKKLSRKFTDFGRNRAAAEISAKAFNPLILRRTKQDVDLDLPPLIERIVYCEMGKAQRHVYEATLGAFRRMINSGLSARVSSIALEALLRLRQCCSFPLLLPSALNPESVSESSKLEAAFQIIDDDMRCERKTIVFSQFRMVSDEIERRLTELGIGVARLDGDTIDRDLPVQRFQNDSSVKVFIVGFRAGGFGLNLTAAESVILFDPWWNPAAESQAFARAHRIGQEKKVFVSKLICSNTIEEKMLQLIASKAELANSLSDLSASMTADELIGLFS